MIYGSVCSGIEAATVAWHPIGWRASFLSEIEAFPRSVLTHHYPDTPLHGDFTSIQAGQYEPIDLLVGGTPCQSFSVIGSRGGMADDRGNLALEYLKLADRLRPKWLVWENVPGVLSSNGGRDFGSFLGGMVEFGYGFAYRVFDAQYDGVGQRRRRVFVVGRLGDWRRAAAVLFERQSLSGDAAPVRRQDETDSAGVSRGAGKRCFGNAHRHGPLEVAGCLTAGGHRLDFDTETFVLDNGRPRRLTPEEYERLQGFPEGYTRVPHRRGTAGDGPRLKSIGNSMAVPVMARIGRQIALAETA